MSRLTGRALLLSEGMFTLKLRPGPGMCPVQGCRRKSKPTGNCGLCDCHHQARWRKKSPKKSAYATLRDHAVARKLEFSLEFSYFEGFMDAAASFDMEAESRGDMVSIDRREAHIGYRKGNLMVLTISGNSRKSNRERYLPAFVQSMLQRKRAKNFEAWRMSEPAGDCPF